MQFYLIFSLIFALLVALFAIQNTMLVVVKFLFWQVELSLVLVILGSAAAGALLVLFFNLFKQYSVHREKKALLQENTRLQKEMDSLNQKHEALLVEKEALIQEKNQTQLSLESCEEALNHQAAVQENEV